MQLLLHLHLHLQLYVHFHPHLLLYMDLQKHLQVYKDVVVPFVQQSPDLTDDALRWVSYFAGTYIGSQNK